MYDLFLTLDLPILYLKSQQELSLLVICKVFVHVSQIQVCFSI